MEILDCPIQHYAWGSTSAIPAIRGVAPDGEPQAEMWAGAHPAAPSLAGGRRLDDLIADDPEAALGQDVLKRFGPTLPFLAKLLAAAEPLSLQVHPSLEQARRGYAAEQDAGVAIDASHRRYKDPNHKPEVLVALTPFHALAGLRSVDETIVVLEGLGVAGSAPFDRLQDDGAASALGRLIGAPVFGSEVAAKVTAAAGAYLAEHDLPTGDPPPHAATEPVDAAAWWTHQIARCYPGDPGIAVALLLNLVDLAPGEAVSLQAGNMHAYLRGTGVEVMASSDNVLRGGLTPKYIDVEELLAVLDPTEGHAPVVAPDRIGPTVRWPTAEPDFAVSMVEPGEEVETLGEHGPRIAIVVEGSVTVTAAGSTLLATAGNVVWIPHSDGPAGVRGDGRVFLASVGPSKAW